MVQALLLGVRARGRAQNHYRRSLSLLPFRPAGSREDGPDCSGGEAHSPSEEPRRQSLLSLPDGGEAREGGAQLRGGNGGGDDLGRRPGGHRRCTSRVPEARPLRRATGALFFLREPRPAPRSQERESLYSPLGGPRPCLNVPEVAALRIHARLPGGKANLRAYGPRHEATARGVLRSPQRASVRPSEHRFRLVTELLWFGASEANFGESPE